MNVVHKALDHSAVLLNEFPKVISIPHRNVNVKTKCRDERKEECVKPCQTGTCVKPLKKPPPCSKKLCPPPIHTCPYDDPCFHCPYTPPPCPKKRDPCCRQPRCFPENPYLFKDICCRPKNPGRVVDRVCGTPCKIKKRECCPCDVCDDKFQYEEFCRKNNCGGPRPRQPLHHCVEEYGLPHCPDKPCCPPPKTVGKFELRCPTEKKYTGCKNE